MTRCTHRMVAGTKEDTEIDHTVCQRRGRDHTLERRNNVCACKFATARSNRRRRRRQRCGKDCARGGGDRRQSERDRWSVTKTKRQCTKFPDRVPGMGETVDDHRQPGNPSILYSVFWTVANPPCSDFHPSHHHVHPMRRKVAYVACLDHYGLWMGSSFDGRSNRHFSYWAKNFTLEWQFSHWPLLECGFAISTPQSTCTLASPSLNCSWWRPPWTPLHPLHPN